VLDRHLAMVAILVAQRTEIVGDVPVVDARYIDHRMVARAIGDGRDLLQDGADEPERSEGRRTHRVGDTAIGPS
jgi:hypothetical protein